MSINKPGKSNPKLSNFLKFTSNLSQNLLGIINPRKMTKEEAIKDILSFVSETKNSKKLSKGILSISKIGRDSIIYENTDFGPSPSHEDSEVRHALCGFKRKLTELRKLCNHGEMASVLLQIEDTLLKNRKA